VGEIVRQLATTSNSRVDEMVVWSALRELDKAGLLASEPPSINRRVRMSRREAMQAVGAAAALAMPIVTSVIVPTAAEAASCRPVGATCTRDSDCCSGHCLALVCAPLGAPSRR